MRICRCAGELLGSSLGGTDLLYWLGCGGSQKGRMLQAVVFVGNGMDKGTI
jgi:hypothetical protein